MQIPWPSLNDLILPIVPDERKALPGYWDRLRAFELCPESDVKVVILGQDPYHIPGMADGLAFSTRLPECPASLRNIYKELRRTHNIQRKGYSLEGWATEGVLLLNTALSVETGKAGSHTALWAPLIAEIIRRMGYSSTKLIWGLLGAKAFEYERFINKDKDVIVKAGHPSPLNTVNPFYGSRFFKRLDEGLIELKHKPIDWSRE